MPVMSRAYETPLEQLRPDVRAKLKKDTESSFSPIGNRKRQESDDMDSGSDSDSDSYWTPEKKDGRGVYSSMAGNEGNRKKEGPTIATEGFATTTKFDSDDDVTATNYNRHNEGNDFCQLMKTVKTPEEILQRILKGEADLNRVKEQSSAYLAQVDQDLEGANEEKTRSINDVTNLQQEIEDKENNFDAEAKAYLATTETISEIILGLETQLAAAKKEWESVDAAHKTSSIALQESLAAKQKDANSKLQTLRDIESDKTKAVEMVAHVNNLLTSRALEAKDSQISILEAAVKSKDQESDNLRDELNSKVGEISNLEGRVVLLEETVEAYGDDVDDIRKKHEDKLAAAKRQAEEEARRAEEKLRADVEIEMQRKLKEGLEQVQAKKQQTIDNVEGNLSPRAKENKRKLDLFEAARNAKPKHR